jgi:hypothetical protein
MVKFIVGLAVTRGAVSKTRGVPYSKAGGCTAAEYS